MEKLLNDWLEFEAETEEQPEVFQSVCLSVMYAMKMGFEDSLNIIITDKAHELLLEHGDVVGLVAELTIQALNALLNISEEAKISIYTYGAATISILLVNDFDDKIKGFDRNNNIRTYFAKLAYSRLYAEQMYIDFRDEAPDFIKYIFYSDDITNSRIIVNRLQNMISVEE